LTVNFSTGAVRSGAMLVAVCANASTPPSAITPNAVVPQNPDMFLAIGAHSTQRSAEPDVTFGQGVAARVCRGEREPLLPRALE
jgi:hypothetical protein